MSDTIWSAQFGNDMHALMHIPACTQGRAVLKHVRNCARLLHGSLVPWLVTSIMTEAANTDVARLCIT